MRSPLSSGPIGFASAFIARIGFLALVFTAALQGQSLSSLWTGGTTLTPAFDPVVFAYTAAVGAHTPAITLRPGIDAVSRRLTLRGADGLFRTVSPGATLVSGREHLLALRDDGSVVAWGANSYGQTTVPNGRVN